MPKRPVIFLKEQDPPKEALLETVGLSTEQWEIYLRILRHPMVSIEDLPGATPDLLSSLEQLGLLRISLERSLGFAPLPPSAAFRRLMTRHDEEVLQSMRTGLQLRALMRTVSEGHRDVSTVESSGIEIFTDINEARDRSYELALKNPIRKQFTTETQLRPIEGDFANRDKFHRNEARAMASADLANRAINEYKLQTIVVDRTVQHSQHIQVELAGLQKLGVTILIYPGKLEQILLREDSHALVWENSYPSRSGTLLLTSPWALRIIKNYFESLLPLCHQWRPSPREHQRSSDLQLVTELIAQGLTDEQISTRIGMSLRTVGRHVAKLLSSLGASTRFEAGVLLERRRQIITLSQSQLNDKPNSDTESATPNRLA